MSTSSLELVNPVPREEIRGWARAMATTFLNDPDDSNGARYIDLLSRVWMPERAWGVRDRGRWVGTLRSDPRVLAVPGAGAQTLDVPVDALTNVTVAGTHRRRGLMRGMLGQSLRAARERGDALSILIAAEWPIYGRFGYAPATLSADYLLQSSRVGARCDGDPTRLRQVERDEFGDLAPAVFDRARTQRAGQIDRSATWWNRLLGRDGYEPYSQLPHNWFVHEGDNGPDGVLAWKATSDFGMIAPLGKLEVWELVTATDDAYRDCWSYLAGIDVIDEMRIANRPVDEPIRWLLHDARTLVMTQHFDFVWVRLLDVPAALAARRYAIPGEVVLEVRDEDGDRFATGRYLLRADAGEVACEPTERAAAITITQRALASIYLGGFRLAQLPASAAIEHAPGARALLDVMFSTPVAPWNATWF